MYTTKHCIDMKQLQKGSHGDWGQWGQLVTRAAGGTEDWGQ